MKIRTSGILFILLLLTLGSCDTTEKILKSSDPNFKYTKAMEWYDKGAYFKAIPVFEELMGLYKGSKTTEELYYYYCMAHYKQKNYILSAYHFKNYVTQHPYSDYTEDALFMYAESFAQQSPKVSLEQTNTMKAIEAYQVYINSYPTSGQLKYCNEKIDQLRDKLEAKALSAADLYYRTQNYRAAAVSYSNLLVDFPDIDDELNIQFKIVESYFKYAEQSVSTKQQERYEETIKAATAFLNRHSDSEFATRVNDLQQQSHLEAINASFNLAMLYVPEVRIEKLIDVKDVYEVHQPSLNEKLKAEADQTLENSYFEMIKANFNLAQDSPSAEKTTHYTATIEAYNEFTETYQESKYLKEADRIHNAAQKNLKKIING